MQVDTDRWSDAQKRYYHHAIGIHNTELNMSNEAEDIMKIDHYNSTKIPKLPQTPHLGGGGNKHTLTHALSLNEEIVSLNTETNKQTKN